MNMTPKNIGIKAIDIYVPNLVGSTGPYRISLNTSLTTPKVR